MYPFLSTEKHWLFIFGTFQQQIYKFLSVRKFQVQNNAIYMYQNIYTQKTVKLKQR